MVNLEVMVRVVSKEVARGRLDRLEAKEEEDILMETVSVAESMVIE